MPYLYSGTKEGVRGPFLFRSELRFQVLLKLPFILTI